MTVPPSHPARLVPGTARIVRGVIEAIDTLSFGDRDDVPADVRHALGMVQMVLGHLSTRSSEATLAELATLEREVWALVGRAGNPVAPADYDEAITRLTAAMDQLRSEVSALQGKDSPLVRAALEIEGRFFAALTPKGATAAADWPPLAAGPFEAYLNGQFPGQYRGLSGFQRLVGGFQKETVLVNASRADRTTEQMVIRAEKNDRFVRFTASDIADEFAIVDQLWRGGLPVAKPLWLEADEKPLGRRFMVSRRARGKNTGSAYGDSQSFPPALTRSFMATLAQIHNHPIGDALASTNLGPWLRFGSLADNTRAEIADWRHQIWLRPAPPSPSFARLFDWLEANVPEEDAPARLLHNDYGPHNILVDGDQVSAVLDWEVCRLGDPAEDIAFFLQCSAGAVDRDAAIRDYVEASGNRLSAYRLAYFDVLSIGKVLVSTLSAAAMYDVTEPALIDWMQMPLFGHGIYQAQIENRIAAAEAARGS